MPDNQKVPTLEEVLQAAKEYDIALLIEPKTHGQEKNLAETLVKLLNKYDIVGKTSIHSFNIDLLKKIKKMQPHLQVGLLIFGGYGHFEITEVDFFSLQERVVTPRTIQNIHNFEKKVFVWTLNDTEKVEQYMKLGVDGIITDYIPEIKAKKEQIRKIYDGSSTIKFRLFGIEISPSKILKSWSGFFSK